MSLGHLLPCTAAKACAVRSHDQGAWVWRRRSWRTSAPGAA